MVDGKVLSMIDIGIIHMIKWLPPFTKVNVKKSLLIHMQNLEAIKHYDIVYV